MWKNICVNYRVEDTQADDEQVDDGTGVPLSRHVLSKTECLIENDNDFIWVVWHTVDANLREIRSWVITEADARSEIIKVVGRLAGAITRSDVLINVMNTDSNL